MIENYTGGLNFSVCEFSLLPANALVKHGITQDFLTISGITSGWLQVLANLSGWGWYSDTGFWAWSTIIHDTNENKVLFLRCSPSLRLEWHQTKVQRGWTQFASHPVFRTGPRTTTSQFWACAQGQRLLEWDSVLLLHCTILIVPEVSQCLQHSLQLPTLEETARW